MRPKDMTYDELDRLNRQLERELGLSRDGGSQLPRGTEHGAVWHCYIDEVLMGAVSAQQWELNRFHHHMLLRCQRLGQPPYDLENQEWMDGMFGLVLI